MSLYIRLRSSFWTHRKTLRLRSLVGESAFWIPPRIWCYAADNQPDGDFSDFSATELALLIGYSGEAEHMLQALLQAGFLDQDLRIHNWKVHNGYHAVFRSRARTAAKARWLKQSTGKDMKGKERKGVSIAKTKTSNASSIEPNSNGSAPNLVPTPEDIYREYPRKVAKTEAVKAIQKASKRFGARSRTASRASWRG